LRGKFSVGKGGKVRKGKGEEGKDGRKTPPTTPEILSTSYRLESHTKYRKIINMLIMRCS